jgi:hypothetical protein
VPQAPSIDGLPLWLQVLVTFIFVVTTAGAAFLGYRSRVEREPVGAATTVLAAFPDLTAIRQLTDQSRILCDHVERLDVSMRDHTHYLRDKIEVDRELCMRMRELKEEMVRPRR